MLKTAIDFYYDNEYEGEAYEIETGSQKNFGELDKNFLD